MRLRPPIDFANAGVVNERFQFHRRYARFGLVDLIVTDEQLD
jgi:hypothetical protein